MNGLLAAFGGGVIAIFIVVLMVGQLFSVSSDGAAVTGAPGQLFTALPTLWLWFGGALACLIAFAVAVQIFK